MKFSCKSRRANRQTQRGGEKTQSQIKGNETNKENQLVHIDGDSVAVVACVLVLRCLVVSMSKTKSSVIAEMRKLRSVWCFIVTKDKAARE